MSTVLIVIQGRHHPGTEAAYEQYMKGSVPLMQRYEVGIEAVGPGLERPWTTATHPINIVLSFPSADHADGFFRDPEYVHIKEAYRDVAYADIHLALFTPARPLGPRSPTVLVATQAELADADARAAQQAAVRPLAAEYGVEVLGSGPGYAREYTTDAWDLTTLLAFPDEATLDAFMADPRYAEIIPLRDRAYGRRQITSSRPRPPRVESNVQRPT